MGDLPDDVRTALTRFNTKETQSLVSLLLSRKVNETMAQIA